MIENKYFNNMRPILVAVFLTAVLVIGLAGVAEASEHTVDVDDGSTTTVEYGQVAVSEDPTISSDTGFVIIDQDGEVMSKDAILTRTPEGNVSTDPSDPEFTILSESGELAVPTKAFYDLVEGTNLKDPRGEYTVRNEIDGSLVVDDQGESAGSGNGEVVIDEFSANVDYNLVVERSGTELANKSYDGGQKFEDKAISLSGATTVTDGETIDVMLVNPDNGRTLNLEDVDGSGTYSFGSPIESTFNVDNSAPSVPVNNNEVTINSFEYDWKLAERGSDNEGRFSDEKDRRVITDTGSKSIDTNFYFGQEIVLGFSEGQLSDSSDYKIRRITDDADAEEMSIDRAIENNDIGVNEEMIRVPSSDLIPEETNTANFALLEDGTKIYEMTISKHRMSIEDEDTKFVNLETSDDTSELNITSSSRIGFDILVESDQLDGDEIIDVIDNSRLSEYDLDSSDISIEEDNDGEDTESVRIENVVGAESNQTIPLDFSGRESGEYGFILSSTDTEASTQAVYNVEFGPSGQASFDKSAYQQNIGDTVEIDVDMTETDQSTFIINDEKYAEDGEDSLKFKLEDENDTGSYTVKFDTYMADETGSLSFEDIIRVDGAEVVSKPSSMPSVAGSLSKGVYDIQLNVSGNQVDQSVIDLEDRNSSNMTTWVLPNTEVTGGVGIDDIDEFGTKKETVAVEDWLVFEIEASGIYSDKLFDDDTHPAALVNYDKHPTATQPTDLDASFENNRIYNVPEVHLEITGDRPAPNEAKPRLKVHEAQTMEVSPSEDKIYLFYRSGNLNNYNMSRSGFNIDELEDIQTDFDAKLNFTSDYKFGGEELDMDENEMNHTYEADMTTEYEMVERTVKAMMPKVVSDESAGIDTKYGLAAENNSTVTGQTEIAPGTDITVNVASDEGSNAIFEQPETTVGENGTVETQYDLGGTEVGRNMTIQFFPMDDPQPAVIIEPNQEPEIQSFDVETPTTVGTEITFESSVNRTTPTTRYNWDFDNGESSQLEQPSAAYDEPGTYNVTLTVDNAPEDDALNLTDSSTVEVVVEEQVNTAPVVRETISPTELDVDEEANFGVVATDENVSSLEYSWDFDDGNSAVGITSTHSYSTAGTYNPVVTITDQGGEETVQELETIQVTDPEPEGPAEYDLTVNVSDAETGEPIQASVGVTNASTDQSEAQGEANQNGQVEFTVTEGNYNIQASSTGYSANEVPGVPVTSNQTINVELQPDRGDQNGGGSDDGNENPDQPGFTFLFGAVALAMAGGFMYRRRESQSNFDGL